MLNAEEEDNSGRLVDNGSRGEEVIPNGSSYQLSFLPSFLSFPTKFFFSWLFGKVDDAIMYQRT